MNIAVYTDGSCDNRKGFNSVGAWAYLYYLDGNESEIIKNSGATIRTTNTSQRMELLAAIKALVQLKKVGFDVKENKIHIYSDSAYMINCFKDKWYEGWIDRNFDGVKNTDLWIKLLNLSFSKWQFEYIHVKGHSGIKYNEAVDKLAGNARKTLQKVN